MPLCGIDVSHHNGSNVEFFAQQFGVDFIIAKATEGVSFVDKKFDENMKIAERHGLLRGAYHYVNPSPQYCNEFRAYQEAKNFVSTVRPYGDCILALDFEESNILTGEGVAFLTKVAEYVKAMTGTPPLIYASESVVKQFDFSGCVKIGCGLWVAKWKKNTMPKVGQATESDYIKANPREFGMVAIQQISSSGVVDSKVYSIDVDIAFMSREAWAKYANPRLYK